MVQQERSDGDAHADPPAENPSSPFSSFSGHHVGIRVPDYDAAKAWYTEKLDFRVLQEWPYGELKLAYLCPQALLELPASGLQTTAHREDGLIYVEESPYAACGHDYLAPLCLDANHRAVLPQRFSATGPITGALDDLTAACGASWLLADVSGPETPPGTALLIGAALASGVQIAAFHPKPTFTHASGREPNWRNLMIQYAVHAHLKDREAVQAWLAM